MGMKLRAEIGTAMLLLGGLVSMPVALPAQQIDCPIQKTSTDPAVTSFRQGDFSKAFELYFSAARNDPHDLQAIAGQIRSLLQEGQISEASQLAESSLVTNPASPDLLTSMGEIRLRQGRLSDAADAYQLSLKLDPCLAR
ncbi:MAG: tetratricopeptide repeat protein, partial [Acidobacteriaceae bacterium]